MNARLRSVRAETGAIAPKKAASSARSRSDQVATRVRTVTKSHRRVYDSASRFLRSSSTTRMAFPRRRTLIISFA
jgi:hypothetical protein